MNLGGLLIYRRRWIQRNTLLGAALIILLFAAYFLLAAFLEYAPLWVLLPVLTSFFIGYLTRNSYPSKAEVKKYLHERVPSLEYSLELVEQEKVHLAGLELIQRDKVANLLEKEVARLPFPKRLISSGLMIATIMSVILVAAGLSKESEVAKNESVIQSPSQLEGNIGLKKDSAYISRMKVRLSPPSYTGRPTTTQQELSMELAEGTIVTWDYEVSPAVEKVDFYFDDERVSAKNSRTFWNAAIYYYSVVDSIHEKVNSDYFSVKVVEDTPPQVEISGIDEYEKLEWRKNYDIDFQIRISDDYGIEGGFISATVATGTGEAVKFREKTFPLKNLGSSDYSFSTGDFGMEPGSELYFYVMAKDNCPFRVQATKSKTYFVVLEDTTTYTYADDAGMQVDLMPDFFRSQRQIIIDSEQLLKDRDDISELEFKQRSNELGYDQKLLRLKYGQFLGEEAESGIALENEIEQEEDDHDHHDHDHDHDHEEVNVLEEYGHNHDHEAEAGMRLEENGTRMEEDPSRPDWVKELAHNHDDGEVNTYFEISLKGKLRKALSVMWDAELHLRLYDPTTSLPFQYEALDHLQEIKNHARIYVHRIGFDPPVIKVAEKRLTGDLDEVVSASDRATGKYEDAYATLRRVVEKFSELRCNDGCELSEMQRDLLEQGGRTIAGLATEDLGLLPGLGILREVINDGRIRDDDQLTAILQVVVKALPREEEIKQDEVLLHPVIQAIVELE